MEQAHRRSPPPVAETAVQQERQSPAGLFLQPGGQVRFRLTTSLRRLQQLISHVAGLQGLLRQVAGVVPAAAVGNPHPVMDAEQVVVAIGMDTRNGIAAALAVDIVQDPPTGIGPQPGADPEGGGFLSAGADDIPAFALQGRKIGRTIRFAGRDPAPVNGPVAVQVIDLETSFCQRQIGPLGRARFIPGRRNDDPLRLPAHDRRIRGHPLQADVRDPVDGTVGGRLAAVGHGEGQVAHLLAAELADFQETGIRTTILQRDIMGAGRLVVAGFGRTGGGVEGDRQAGHLCSPCLGRYRKGDPVPFLQVPPVQRQTGRIGAEGRIIDIIRRPDRTHFRVIGETDFQLLRQDLFLQHGLGRPDRFVGAFRVERQRSVDPVGSEDLRFQFRVHGQLPFRDSRTRRHQSQQQDQRTAAHRIELTSKVLNASFSISFGLWPNWK